MFQVGDEVVLTCVDGTKFSAKAIDINELLSIVTMEIISGPNDGSFIKFPLGYFR